ncbi:ATPase [Colletotrichum truncatum]|uniref:ATPase n=1 Tax=Colletotrichum truncatum TaxID=5467 RepID=A0ACC3Z1S7_COLTU|nr:ATPase [Colletotrichum truncatum]KAF6788804.1 ATPase [Colletotrichum truncatum]
MSTVTHEATSEKITTLEHRYVSLLESRIKDLESQINKVNGSGAKCGPLPAAKNSTNAELDVPSKVETSNTSATVPSDASSENGPRPLCRIIQRSVETEDGSAERELEQSELLKLGLETLAAGSEYKGTPPQLTWVRFVETNNRYSSSDILVEGSELKALLSVVLEAYPDLHISIPDSPSSKDGAKDPVVFNSPCEPLIHNWSKLSELALENSSLSAELELRIEKSGPRTGINTAGGDDQTVRALVHLGMADNLKKAREQLGRLLKLVTFLPELSKYFQSLERQTSTGYIQFAHLWTIFPPGEIVYSTVFMDEPQIFIVKDSSAPEEELSSGETWSMVAWSYDWDGACFNRVPVTFEFEHFTGSRVINTLHCHPFRFHKPGETISSEVASREALEAVLLERGKRFTEVCIKPRGSQMFDYNGRALLHGSGFQNKLIEELEYFRRMFESGRPSRKQRKTTTKKRLIQGRVMVDFEAFLEYSPGRGIIGPMGSAIFKHGGGECLCSDCITNDALRDSQKMYYDRAKDPSQFEDLQFKLCPPRVLGYHLESRTWLELNISKPKGASSENAEDGGSYLKDIKKLRSREAFNKLQLLSTQKSLIQDLVQCHSSGNNSEPLMTDIIKGKGKGLVILLHGPPGVGKTLTAESVAQLAGKPLFSVGVSDIGLIPEEVEPNLEALFELAANWRAVLLFDEADVFLESRSGNTSDLNRNALVSVLLRVLEYYDGILILTTNRITQFDIAVQSRVNLGIKYDDLAREQKQDIFNNFIDQLKPHQIADKNKIKEWFKDDEEARDWTDGLNGRQIRNILFSAASLAHKNDGQLKQEHITRMVKSTWRFHDGIKTVVDDARRRAEVGRN